MTDQIIARWRLDAQRLARPELTGPADAVRWLGAVQAQDYVAALLGVGLRVRGGTEAGVEKALADRAIVRTHFMRNTVHLLPAEDLRWMMRLMAPRIRSLIDNVGRANGVLLDERVYARSNEVIAEQLRGGRQLTRPELAVALQRGGVRADAASAVTLLTQRAQVDGLICHGTRRGARYGLVLVDDWLPPGRTLDREEALAVLAGRYFRSHGPATVQDYAWWSGLTLADARAGLEAVRPELRRHVHDGRTYWYAEPPPAPAPAADEAHLLANYDEYLVGYTDRSAVFDTAYRAKVRAPTNNVLFANTIEVNGEILGTWRRTKGRSSVAVSATLFRALRAGERDAVEAAARRYGAFLERPVELSHAVV